MRKDDHQFFQDIYIACSARTNQAPFDEEKTGWGWRLGVVKIDTGRRWCRRPARWSGPD